MAEKSNYRNEKRILPEKENLHFRLPFVLREVL